MIQGPVQEDRDWAFGGTPRSPEPASRGTTSSSHKESQRAEPNSDPGPTGPNETLLQRLGRWVPVPSPAVAILILAAVAETAVLSWAQYQNYLSFLSTQGDLGDYNQMFYTASHGQGFFYYTTNIPGGGSGTLWSTHFAPLLVVILPFYALVPQPITLIVIKQFALALGAIPIYGIARTYLGRTWPALLMGFLYLLSPLTMATDWNSFDPEAFIPLTVLVALYFLARARLGWFLLAWAIALSTIESTPAILVLFASTALVATFLWPRLAGGLYWDAYRLRRPLFLGLILAGAWLGLAYLVLHVEGPRGGGFGDAYAIRFTVLGANSLPDVIPHALTHPGAAGAALQFGLGQKLLFAAILLSAAGGLTVFGGVRYVVPVLAYLVLAFLSNNPSLYVLGTQYVGMISPFLFVGAIEGAVTWSEWLGGPNTATRRSTLKAGLAGEAEHLRQEHSEQTDGQTFPSDFLNRQSRIVAELGAEQLGLAEHHLDSLKAKITGPKRSSSYSPPGRSSEPEKTPSSVESTRELGRGWIRFRLTRRDLPWLTPVVLIMVCVLFATAVSNPLLSKPMAGAPETSFGVTYPTFVTLTLQNVLSGLPANGAVLTVPHLFPQLSDRREAYVVPNGAYLPKGKTLSDDYNDLSGQSNYIATDFLVDPIATTVLLGYTNLSDYSLADSRDGASVYVRGVQGESSASYLAGAVLQPIRGVKTSEYSTSLGPELYFSGTAPVGAELWNGPHQMYLPAGEYRAEVYLNVTAPAAGTLLTIEAVESPVTIVENVLLNTSSGLSFREASVHVLAPLGAPVAARSVTASSALGFHTAQPILWFNLTRAGYVQLEGFQRMALVQSYLSSVAVAFVGPPE
jgi:uncharacterized membrane protein